MKKTLLCLAIGILSFYVGIFSKSLIYWNNLKLEVPPVQTNKIPIIDNTIIACPPVSTDFEIVEGDYDSQQNKKYWMYLYSTIENGKYIVVGDVRVGSKIYDIKSNNPFNPVTGELSFTTERIGKVFFRFSGKIFQKNYKDGESVLEGKLEKFKNGKVIEVSKHKFKFYFHVCSQ